MMLLAHKVELRPTPEQAEYLDRACGSRRHAFNQLLAHFSQDGVKWSKKAAHEHYRKLRIELARAVNDAGFGMLRQFIEYKAELRDCQVVIADRFFPSSNAVQRLPATS